MDRRKSYGSEMMNTPGGDGDTFIMAYRYIPLRDKETRRTQLVLIIVLVRFGSFLIYFLSRLKFG